MNSGPIALTSQRTFLQLVTHYLRAVTSPRAGGAIAICLFSTGLFGQTVTLTNTTRGGSSVFYIGDAFEFDIHGDANAPVTYAYSGASPTSVGSTDSSGNLTITGYIYEGSEGCWNETWTVDGSTASPNPVSFCVYPANESAGCSLSTTGAVGVFNEDVWDPSFYFYYTNDPYVGAYLSAVSTQDWCPIAADYAADAYGSLSGYQSSYSTFTDSWWVYDNDYRPGLVPDGTPPDWYYPYVDQAVVFFGAVNITNLSYDWDSSELTLVVYWTY